MGERINLKTVGGWVTLGVTCVALVFWLGVLAILFPIVLVLRMVFD